jgi:hypothetical protein
MVCEVYYNLELLIEILCLVNIGIGESKNIRRPLSAIDLPTLRQRAIERLDLPVSQRLLETKEFEPSIIEQCWMDQLQFKRKNNEKQNLFLIFIYLGDGFVDGVDLYIACKVLKKQMESCGDDETKIIVPRIALENIYQRRHEPLLNNSNQSYSGKTRFYLQSIKVMNFN